MFYKRLYTHIAGLLFVFLLPSCTSITASVDVSSGTVVNASGSTSDLTSSTSKGDDDDVEAGPDVAAESFVGSNFSQLRTDMAAGGGEYLATFAILLNIDETKRADFYSLAKAEFNQIFTSSNTSPEEVVANARKVIGEAGI